ncbi:MAG: bifunctional glutamate--cysteine ligase GshA/glutathione synthetase GshB [Leptospiraceae bacterium]|nr:bifunctional glutamate--cysteine ligase GshA/glutathione synthetase GshB [Leptospiraceae bacterium]
MNSTPTPQDFTLPGFEDLEISTQILIRAARSRGIEVEILDRRSHFLRLRKGDRVQLVKEASKTALDSYISFLIMENKQVTKQLLMEAGLRVPTGKQYHKRETAVIDFPEYEDQSIVIKPTSTNFGIGVSTIQEPCTHERFITALDRAFDEDESIIIEEFFAGEEYRFLIIGTECVAVCNRVPANVIGDGRSTIKDLVEKKNADPRRGVGHVTPLEKIQLGETELRTLKQAGKDAGTVPNNGERVFLRHNSNISTGGDSIDFTDQMHSGYKEIAVRAAQTADARICGVDIIVRDIQPAPTNENYAIIELNFNPVLYIHDFPYEGQNRNVAEKILDLLDY